MGSEEADASVSSFWVDGRGWRWEAFGGCLPASPLLEIASKSIDLTRLEMDQVRWAGSTRGDFTVASAYAFGAGSSDVGTWGNENGYGGSKFNSRLRFSSGWWHTTSSSPTMADDEEEWRWIQIVGDVMREVRIHSMLWEIAGVLMRFGFVYCHLIYSTPFSMVIWRNGWWVIRRRRWVQGCVWTSRRRWPYRVG